MPPRHVRNSRLASAKSLRECSSGGAIVKSNTLQASQRLSRRGPLRLFHTKRAMARLPKPGRVIIAVWETEPGSDSESGYETEPDDHTDSELERSPEKRHVTGVFVPSTGLATPTRTPPRNRSPRHWEEGPSFSSTQTPPSLPPTPSPVTPVRPLRPQKYGLLTPETEPRSLHAYNLRKPSGSRPSSTPTNLATSQETPTSKSSRPPLPRFLPVQKSPSPPARILHSPPKPFRHSARAGRGPRCQGCKPDGSQCGNLDHTGYCHHHKSQQSPPVLQRKSKSTSSAHYADQQIRPSLAEAEASHGIFIRSEYYKLYYNRNLFHPDGRSPPADYALPDGLGRFFDHVHNALCSHTQHKLKGKMEKPRLKTQGYMYAFEISDFGTPEHRSIKVGCAQNPLERMKHWKRCRNDTKLLRIWPQSDDPSDLLEGWNTPVKPTNYYKFVESLVHVELRDLALHTSYREDGSGRVKDQSDARCKGCKRKHREIFAIKRHKGRQGAELDVLDEIVERWMRYAASFPEDK